MIGITRYFVKEPLLRPWVRFIWRIEAERADFHYKLLPTGCIDLILNLADAMVYERASEKTAAPPFHINGLRSTHSLIHQEGAVCVYGISFYPYGLYPFVPRPMEGIQEELVDLYAFAPAMAERLGDAAGRRSPAEIVSGIEDALLAALGADQGFVERARMMLAFTTDKRPFTIRSFCQEQGVNLKTFERMVLRYTGFTPKALHSVCRFQAAGNQLAHGGPAGLAAVAYDNGFADQAHFIKAFKRFSGAAPGAFLAERASVKEHAAYTYV